MHPLSDLVCTDEHKYFLKDRRLVGVNEALVSVGLLDKTFIKPGFAELGTYVHTTIELFESNDLNEGSLDPILAAYLQSYKLAKQELGLQTILIEQKVFSPIYGFAGRLDLFCQKDCEFPIIDFKSGANQPADKFATALYYQGLADCLTMIDKGLPTPTMRGSLYLQKDGSMAKFKPHSDPADVKVALAAVAVANAKLREGII